jgi:hypothetical protein
MYHKVYILFRSTDGQSPVKVEEACRANSFLKRHPGPTLAAIYTANPAIPSAPESEKCTVPCSLLFSPVSFAPFLTPLPHPGCLALCTDRKRRSPRTTWAGPGPSPHRSACARRRGPQLSARTAPLRSAPWAPRARAGL